MMRIRTRVTRSIGGNALVLIFMLLAGAFTVLPILYSVLNAFKPINELFLYPPRFFVYHPTLDNFTELIKQQQDMLVPFERYVLNSVLVTVVATAAYVLLAALAAYPMAKHDFPGKAALMAVVVGAILFRPEVTAIPQFIIISKLYMVDTYASLILPALATSFGVFLMRQFMSTIPDELLESARLDGAGEWGSFWRIVMPISRPAWLTLVILTFQSVWNTTGVQYIYTENLKMLPTALNQISTAGLSRAGVGSAVALLLMIPPIVIFMISQGSVMQTMAHSGLKS